MAEEDEEIDDRREIDAFYAILAVRYAVLCRAGEDVEFALKCAHVCLTVTWQLDQNAHESKFLIKRWNVGKV